MCPQYVRQPDHLFVRGIWPRYNTRLTLENKQSQLNRSQLVAYLPAPCAAHKAVRQCGMRARHAISKARKRLTHIQGMDGGRQTVSTQDTVVAIGIATTQRVQTQAEFSCVLPTKTLCTAVQTSLCPRWFF